MESSASLSSSFFSPRKPPSQDFSRLELNNSPVDIQQNANSSNTNVPIQPEVDLNQLAAHIPEEGQSWWDWSASLITNVAVSTAQVISQPTTLLTYGSSVVGNLAIMTLKVLGKVTLDTEKREYLKNKCQPFTSQALPQFTAALAPILADKIKEISGWIPAQNDSAKDLLRDAPQDLILVITSRIVNFFDPGQQISEDLFEISCILDDDNRDFTFDGYKEKIKLYLSDSPDIGQFESLCQELDDIKLIWNTQDRNCKLELFSQKVAALNPPKIHPVATLINQLFEILRIDDRTPVNAEKELLLNSLIGIAQLQSNEARKGALDGFQKTADGILRDKIKDEPHRKKEIEEQGFALGALVSELTSLTLIEKDEDREAKFQQFIDQCVRNYYLGCFAARATTILIGVNGEALPFGRAASLFTGTIFRRVQITLAKLLWQHGRDWLAMPAPNEDNIENLTDKRYRELLNIATKAGQHFIDQELKDLQDAKIYDTYLKRCDLLAKWLFDLAEEHLPEDKRDALKSTLNSGLRSILEWVRSSEGIQQWVNGKVPDILEFLQPYIAPLLRTVEENFTRYLQNNPWYLPRISQDIEKLTKPPTLDVVVPLNEQDVHYPVIRARAEASMLKRVVKQRTESAILLMHELIDICLKGDVEAESSNLQLPPALAAFVHKMAGEAASKSLLLSLLQDYVLTPATMPPSQKAASFFTLFELVAQSSIQQELGAVKTNPQKCEEYRGQTLEFVTEHVHPYLPPSYADTFDGLAKQAIEKVFVWMFKNTDKLLESVFTYLPYGVRITQNLFAPVLLQIQQNIVAHGIDNPKLLEGTLKVVEDLLKRPTYDEAEGASFQETQQRQAWIINAKADLAMDLLNLWAGILFKDTKGELNWPLASKLRELLYQRVTDLLEAKVVQGADGQETLEESPVRTLLIKYIPLYLPVKYAPQEEEVSPEYSQAIRFISVLGAKAGEKVVSDLIHSKLDPKTIDDTCLSITQTLFNLAKPYVAEDGHAKLQTVISDLISSSLPAIAAIDWKMHLGTFAQCFSSIMTDFLPVVIKQMEHNIAAQPYWSELLKAQLDLLKRVPEAEQAECFNASLEGTLKHLLGLAHILVGTYNKETPEQIVQQIYWTTPIADSNDEYKEFIATYVDSFFAWLKDNPVPNGQTPSQAFASYFGTDQINKRVSDDKDFGLVLAGINTQLDRYVDQPGNLPLPEGVAALLMGQGLETLRTTLTPLLNDVLKYVITPQAATEIPLRHQFLISLLDIETKAAAQPILTSLSVFESATIHLQQNGIDCEQHLPFIQEYINKWLINDNPHDYATSYTNEHNFEAVASIVQITGPLLHDYKARNQDQRLEIETQATSFLQAFIPDIQMDSTIRNFIDRVFNFIAADNRLPRIIDLQLNTLIEFAQAYLMPVLPQLEENLRVFLSDEGKLALLTRDLANIATPVTPNISSRPKARIQDELGVHKHRVLPLPAERLDTMERLLNPILHTEKKAADTLLLAYQLVDVVLGIPQVESWPKDESGKPILVSSLPMPGITVGWIRSLAHAALVKPENQTLLLNVISRYIVTDPETSAKVAEKKKLAEQGLGKQGINLTEEIQEFLLALVTNNQAVLDKFVRFGTTQAEAFIEQAGRERYTPSPDQAQFNLQALGIDLKQVADAVSNSVGFGGRQNLKSALRPILQQTLTAVIGNFSAPLANHKGSIRTDADVTDSVHKLVARVNNHVEALWNMVEGTQDAYPLRHPAVNESEFAYFQDHSVRLISHLFGPYCSDLPLGKKGQEEVYDLLLEMLPTLLEEQVGKLAVDELLIRGVAGAVLPQKADDAAADIPEGKAIDHPFVDVGGPSFGHAATGRLVVQTGLRVADMAIPGHGSLSNAAKMMRLDKWLGSFIMKKIGSYIEEDASLQSQVLKIGQFGIEQLPVINEKILEIDLDKKEPTQEEIALEAAKSAAELKQMKEDLQAKFEDLYSRPIGLIDSAVNGPARSVRRAFARAQARALNWSNNLMVCYDCRWIGQKARFMVGSVAIPAVFSVVGALVTALEAISTIVHAIVETIYRKTTNMMWGEGWEEAQAKRLMAILEDKNYKHLLFHLMDDLVDTICQDAAVPSQEAANA